MIPLNILGKELIRRILQNVLRMRKMVQTCLRTMIHIDMRLNMSLQKVIGGSK